MTDYLGDLELLWLGVDDPPGPDSERGVIERGAISLLSNLDRPVIDPPSARWLGSHADRRLVRESGLWNVTHVRDVAGGDWLSVLERWIDAS